MTLEDFFSLLTQLIFLFIAGSTLADWLRQRDRSRLDIALSFVAFSLVFIAQDVGNLFPALAGISAAVLALALLSQPYLLLRVARYFRPVPRPIAWAALAGLVVAGPVSILATEASPVQPEAIRSAAALLAIVYFAAVEVYVAVVLVQGGMAMPGITGKRLRFASAGSGFLALIFFILLALFMVRLFGEVPPETNNVTGPLIQGILILSGLSYYLGFAPPRWLRRTWQYGELRRFLRQKSGQVVAHERALVFEQLATAAGHAVGGMATGIARWDTAEPRLTITVVGESPKEIAGFGADPASAGQAWREGGARVVHVPADASAEINAWAGPLGIAALLVVPIVSPLRPWGVLLVGMRFTPLFAEDDLEVLTLLAEQSAVTLDYASLIDELHTANQTLEQRVAERTTELSRANRALRAISDCNQELVRAESESELLNSICRIIVATGGYRMAWVGYPQQDAARSVLPAAWAGYVEGYFEAVRLSYDEAASDLSPMGNAIRTGLIQVIHTASDTAFAEWRQEAIRRSYVSGIAVPLKSGDRVFGGLGIFSTERDSFDEQEVKLMVELANDLAYGITALRLREAHALAVNALQQSEEHFRLIVDTALDGVITIDSQGRVTGWNAQAENMFGWQASEIVGLSLAETIVPHQHREAHRRGLERFLATGEGPVLNKRFEITGLRRDRREIPVELAITPVVRGEAVTFSAFVRDISERKQAEEALRRSDELLRETNRMAKVGGWELDLATMTLYWSEETYRIHEVDPSERPALENAIHFYAPEARPIVTEAVEKAIAEGAAFDLVLPFITATGTRLWVRAQGRPELRDGACVRLSGTFQDVTKLKQAEEELKFSEARLSAIIEQSPLSIQIFAPDGAFVRANQAWERLWSARREQLAGYNILADPQLKARGIMPVIEAAFAGEVVTTPPIYYDPADVGQVGRPRWASGMLYPVRDAAGNILEVVLTHEDITDRREAEEALRRSEEHFRALIQNSADVVQLLDAEGLIKYVSPSVVRVLGYTPEALVGRPAPALLHPDEFDLLQQSFAGLLAQPGQNVTLEQRARHQNGSWRWIEVTASNLLDNPAVNAVVVNYHDITARKHAESLLRVREEHAQSLFRLSRNLERAQAYADILNSAREELYATLGLSALWVYLLTDDGKFFKALIAGGQPVEAAARGDYALLPIAGDRMLEEIAEARDMVVVEDARTDERTNKEIVGQLGNRTIVNVPMILLDRKIGTLGTGTFGEQGIRRLTEIEREYLSALANRVAVTLDRIRVFNERIQAEVRLRETLVKLEQNNRELQDFAYVASHDLQEPLRKIQAFGDRLVTVAGDHLDDRGRDYLQRMHAAAARMQILIDDLLAFSRVTTKAQPFTLTDLNVVLAGVLSDLEARIEKTGGRVDAALLPTLQADSTQMRQMLQNLVGNGLKFHKPGEPPQVRVACEPAPDGDWRIIVSDNGIGFDEKYLDRIFVPFQRLHGRNEYEGTGIGLAVVRKIVERHNGSITARSAPGQGASFIITLPAPQRTP